MQRLIEWYDNRMDCFFCGVEMPILDWIMCIVSLPFAAATMVALAVTCPIWGIPYAIYRAWSEQNDHNDAKF